eukprot:CAMPEP_0184391336 /NCGR_PEP_ID=MMETSP0007-20130409/14013_1 /TAXON_ID=97485 /ORGANISM="Prymnesium parvum, Strain Texoma1" /LENGTH=165 /DNA_ID=CAMNT_0026741407 /DNA_START=351 /DNA_END=848 /DNA_ORIENTATION=-
MKFLHGGLARWSCLKPCKLCDWGTRVWPPCSSGQSGGSALLPAVQTLRYCAIKTRERNLKVGDRLDGHPTRNTCLTSCTSLLLLKHSPRYAGWPNVARDASRCRLAQWLPFRSRRRAHLPSDESFEEFTLVGSYLLAVELLKHRAAKDHTLLYFRLSHQLVLLQA